MTEQIYSRNARKIIQNRKILESSLGVKLSVKTGIVFLEGKSEDEFLALRVIEAIDLGFSIETALLLKEEEMAFEKVFIKKIEKRTDMSQVRARIVGTNRKALDTIESLANCYISLHDNTLGVIGKLESVKKALFVLKRIIAGSKHAKMYAWLEAKNAEEKGGFYN